jgi:hypothetical protein
MLDQSGGPLRWPRAPARSAGAPVRRVPDDDHEPGETEGEPGWV